MFSNPPATTTALSPARIDWSASITAWSPLPQTLLIVCALRVSGSPGLQGRPGGRDSGPSPACSTQPMMHSSTQPGGVPGASAKCGLDGPGSQLWTGDTGQPAEKSTDGSSFRRQDDTSGHRLMGLRTPPPDARGSSERSSLQSGPSRRRTGILADAAGKENPATVHVSLPMPQTRSQAMIGPRTTSSRSRATSSQRKSHHPGATG